MCVFTGKVSSVADTRIFARLTGHNTQLLVYEMSYAAADDLAMVLPLPVSSRDEDTAVRFIDLSAQPDFFRLLGNLIWLYEKGLGSRGSMLAGSGEPVKPPLKIHEVGAFDASYVPSLEDFDRLDARFKLSKDVWVELPQYRDYGFAVFKLCETGKTLKGVHPMAFEFSTRLTNTIFAPTIHVHDGQVYPNAWFDHQIYLQADQCALREGERKFLDGKEAGVGVDKHDLAMPVRMRGWKLKQRGSPDKDRFGVVRVAARDMKVWSGVSQSAFDRAVGPKEARERWEHALPEDREKAIRFWRNMDRDPFPADLEEDREAFWRWKRLSENEREQSARLHSWIELLRFLPDSHYRAHFLKLMPIIDPTCELHAVGLSGLLPNIDTLIGVG